MEAPTPFPMNPASTLAIGQNRVLRNTYLMLAISMVPTVLGAGLGLMLNLSEVFAGSPFMSLLVFFGGAFALMFAIDRNKNSAMGVVFLLAFTFFMGLMLSRLLGYILPMKNGSQIVMLAFGGTALIFGAMSAVALTIKRDLAFMGKFLLIGAGMLMIAGIANVFLLLPGLMIAIAVLAIGIFSALMVYDINRILTGGQTNYVIATLEIYLDIYNVFQSLLILLGFSSSDD